MKTILLVILLVAFVIHGEENCEDPNAQLGNAINTLNNLFGNGDKDCAPEKKEEEYECVSNSPIEEYAPIQIGAKGLPEGAEHIRWTRPSGYTTKGPFASVPEEKADHEGADLIHSGEKDKHVPVFSMAEGTVAYVRLGCPQDSMFEHNNLKRECGSGWGNHVVVKHANGIYSRYAHMEPGSIKVKVGDKVSGGKFLGMMGNSGRSEVRHLHLELGKGIRQGPLDPCGPSKSFERVFDPGELNFSDGFELPKNPLKSTSKKCLVETDQGFAEVKIDAKSDTYTLRTLLNGSNVKTLKKKGEFYAVEFNVGTTVFGKHRPVYMHESNLKCN